MTDPELSFKPHMDYIIKKAKGSIIVAFTIGLSFKSAWRNSSMQMRGQGYCMEVKVDVILCVGCATRMSEVKAFS